MCYSVLQCVAVCCSVLHRLRTFAGGRVVAYGFVCPCQNSHAPPSAAVRRSVLQRVAACIVSFVRVKTATLHPFLQFDTMCCSTYIVTYCTSNCNTLQHTVTHYNTLQYAATRCCSTLCHHIVQYGTMCCSVLQCVAVCCSVLQRVAVCYSV